jgi:hypothetical protein
LQSTDLNQHVGRNEYQLLAASGLRSLFFPAQSGKKRVLQYGDIMQFQEYDNRKERKERRDKDLWRFFFGIFAIFVVNPASVPPGRAGASAAKSGSSSRPGPKVAALAQKNIDTNCIQCRVASGRANHWRVSLAWRRLPSLPCRRFPNLPAVARGAGLEAGDTAGLETCGTQARQGRANQMLIRGQAQGEQGLDWWSNVRNV